MLLWRYTELQKRGVFGARVFKEQNYCDKRRGDCEGESGIYQAGGGGREIRGKFIISVKNVVVYSSKLHEISSLLISSVLYLYCVVS